MRSSTAMERSEWKTTHFQYQLVGLKEAANIIGIGRGRLAAGGRYRDKVAYRNGTMYIKVDLSK